MTDCTLMLTHIPHTVDSAWLKPQVTYVYTSCTDIALLLVSNFLIIIFWKPLL